MGWACMGYVLCYWAYVLMFDVGLCAEIPHWLFVYYKAAAAHDHKLKVTMLVLMLRQFFISFSHHPCRRHLHSSHASTSTQLFH